MERQSDPVKETPDLSSSQLIVKTKKRRKSSMEVRRNSSRLRQNASSASVLRGTPETTRSRSPLIEWKPDTPDRVDVDVNAIFDTGEKEFMEHIKKGSS